MNGSRVLAAEFVLAVGFASWGAIKAGFWPWPPTIVRIGVGFAVLGLIAQVNEEVAATLGGGFLLATFLRQYQKGLKNYQGGVDINTSIYPILIGGMTSAKQKGK